MANNKYYYVQRKIQLVGRSARVQGEKNGKPYDFTPCYFIRSDERVEGYKAFKCNVGQEVIPSERLVIGEEFCVIMAENFIEEKYFVNREV